MSFPNVENTFEELERKLKEIFAFLPIFSTIKNESVEKVFQIEKMSKN